MDRNPTQQASNTPQPHRRRVLQTGMASILATGAAPLFMATQVRGQSFGKDVAPSERITLGFIGLGTHGFGYNLKSFLTHKDCRAVAVCDTFKSRTLRARDHINKTYEDKACKTYDDFRDLLADDSIDAVVISTPDHWHVPLSLLALAAGKDVFCEKPTLTIQQGRDLVNAVKKSDKVFSGGIEDRSLIHYHKIAQAVRNGAIGKLQEIHVGLPGGDIYPYEKPAPVPDDLNWNLWLGPAPEKPYTPSRITPQGWRNIRDYSGGKLTDWGAHLMDTAQVANFAELSGPVEVQGKGVIPPNAMNTVPATWNIKYTYANDVVMHVTSSQPSIRFLGTDGWVGNTGWRGRLLASNTDIYLREYTPTQDKLWPMPPTEHRNFLDCVRSRNKDTTYNPEALHRLSTTMHLGAISMELGKKLKWNPDTETFNDDAANKLRTRAQRNDWQTG